MNTNRPRDQRWAAYIERVHERKAEKRRAKSIEIMAGKHYDCELCIHGLTHNCTDNLPHGCEYYSNESRHDEMVEKTTLVQIYPLLRTMLS